MGAYLLLLEVVSILIAFRLAAELISRATNELEDIFGQGFAAGVVLGIITAIPETLVVIIAIMQQSYGVAIGAALGGNIILFTLGTGMVGIVYFGKWKAPVQMKDDYAVEFNFLLAATLLFIAIAAYQILNPYIGVILIILYVGYLAIRYSNARDVFVKNERKKSFRKDMERAVLYIIAGFIVVALLSGILVGDISGLANLLQIPAIWLSLVIVPIFADLSENINAYKLAKNRKGGGSTAIVSFIGSKLQNNTLLLGLVCLFALPYLPIANALPEFIAIIAVNVIALLVMKRGSLDYKLSVFLIAFYFAIIGLSLLA
jgi:cation:H+ antiporter